MLAPADCCEVEGLVWLPSMLDGDRELSELFLECLEPVAAPFSDAAFACVFRTCAWARSYSRFFSSSEVAQGVFDFFFFSAGTSCDMIRCEKKKP